MQKVDKEKTRYYLAKIHILFRDNFRTQELQHQIGSPLQDRPGPYPGGKEGGLSPLDIVSAHEDQKEIASGLLPGFLQYICVAPVEGVAFHDDGSDFHLFFSLLPDTAPDLLSIAFPGAGAKTKSFHERAYIPAAAPNAPTGAREKNDKECIGFCT
jgi:hypothetical protein